MEDSAADGFTSYEALRLYITTVPEPVAMTGLVLGSLIVSLIVLGNTLLIVAILRDRRMRTSTNAFLVSMALAEILTMGARDVLVLATYAKGYWDFGSVALYVNNLMDRVRQTVAIEHVLVITGYRYVMIVHNKYYQRISGVGCIACVIAAIYLLPTVFMIFYNIKLINGDIEMEQYIFFNTKYMKMMTTKEFYQYELSANASDTTNTTETLPSDAPTDSGRVGSPVWLTFPLTIFAAGVLCAFYLHIYSFLKRHAMNMKTWGHRRNTDQEGPASNPTGGLSKRKQRHEVRFVKLMAVVFLCYVFAYFWIPCIRLADKRGTFSHGIYLPFLLINWSNAVMNWIIYALGHPYIRQSFTGMVSRGRIATESHSAETTAQ